MDPRMISWEGVNKKMGKLSLHHFDESPTPREREVLALVVKGKRNREIAEELSVSENTIETHVHRILQKFGVANRTEATTYALTHGIIELKKDGEASDAIPYPMYSDRVWRGKRTPAEAGV